MAEKRVLAPEQIARLAVRLAGLRVSWSPVELDRVVGELGWTVFAAPRRPGGSAVVQTGLPVFGGHAAVGLFGDDEGEIVVKVSDPEENRTPIVTAVNRDAFAAAVRAITSAVGEPVERRPGSVPEVRWPAASGVLRVIQGTYFVELALLSTKYAELLDDALADPVDDDLVGEDS